MVIGPVRIDRMSPQKIRPSVFTTPNADSIVNLGCSLGDHWQNQLLRHDTFLLKIQRRIAQKGVIIFFRLHDCQYLTE
jgi:hypothetical protein